MNNVAYNQEYIYTDSRKYSNPYAMEFTITPNL